MDASTPAEGTPGAVPPGRLSDRPIGELRDTQDPGVDVALNLIVAMAANTIRTADGVSITVGRGDTFSTVAASDQRIYSMDGDQYELAEGPCLSAAVDRRRFHAPNMNDESRWPQFSARAAERGINAILSTPISLDDQIHGALNVYSTRPFAFGGVERATASVYAAQAAAVLKAEARGDMSGSALGQSLQSAVQMREFEAFRRAVLNWTSLTSEDEDAAFDERS